MQSITDIERITTEAGLRALGISLGLGTEEALLPFVHVDAQEFAALEAILGFVPERRTLTIGIGKGVTYHVARNAKYGEYIEVTFHAQADAFYLPLHVTIATSHEAQTPEEHYDGCPYACEEWPKNEDGESYWVYEYEDDTPDSRHYEPECFCDYVDDDKAEFVINDPADSALVTNFVANHWNV